MRKSDKPFNDDYKDVDWDDELFEDSYEDVPVDSVKKRRVGEDSLPRDPYAYDGEDRRRRDRYEYDSEGSRDRRGSREGREEDRRRRDRYEYDSRDREDRREREARREREERREREARREREERREREARREREERREREARREREERPRKKSKGGCCLGGCLIPVIIFFAIIFGLVYMGMGLFTGRMRDAGFSKSSVKTNSDLPSSTEEAMKGYRNIMLFGVDARDQDPLGEGALADSCMLLSINKKTGDIQILSIYRDTYVETTDGSHKKLTEVYAASGPKETLQTINRNFDLDIHEYVTYTWAAVAHYIDGIGGMDIRVTAAEAAGINKYIDEVIKNTGISSSHVLEDISSEGEICHLDGVQAVTFCRLRKGLGDDYKRTERQRTVVSKAVSMAKLNPVSAAVSAYQIMPEIASNLKQADLLALMGGFLTYDMKNAAGFPYEVEDVTLSGASYLYANTLIANNRKLHEELFGNHNYEPSGTVEELHRREGDRFGY